MTAPLDWPGNGACRETLRTCRFVRREFRAYASLRLIDPDDEQAVPGHTVTAPYTGQGFDPLTHELVEGDWDHEHCLVCSHTISPGDTYWGDPDRCVELCLPCHEKYLRHIGRPAG